MLDCFRSSHLRCSQQISTDDSWAADFAHSTVNLRQKLTDVWDRWVSREWHTSTLFSGRSLIAEVMKVVVLSRCANMLEPALSLTVMCSLLSAGTNCGRGGGTNISVTMWVIPIDLMYGSFSAVEQSDRKSWGVMRVAKTMFKWWLRQQTYSCLFVPLCDWRASNRPDKPLIFSDLKVDDLRSSNY